MQELDIYIRSFRHTVAERPERALRRVFGLDPEQAREFVASLPRVVKRRIPADQRERYERVLGEMGAELEFRPSPIQPARTVAVVGGPASHAPAPERLPGRTMTLGEPLADPPPLPSSRPPPAWPPSSSQPPPLDSAPPPASVPAAAPPGPSPHPDHLLGTAETARMEAAGLPPEAREAVATGAAATPPAAPARTVVLVGAAQPTPLPSTNAPLRGPAFATVPLQPAFTAAAAPAPRPEAARPVTQLEGQARAEPGGSWAGPTQLGGSSPPPPLSADTAGAGSPAVPPASERPPPGAAPHAVDPAPRSSFEPHAAAQAYSEASTAESLKLDSPAAARKPSWLVEGEAYRQGGVALGGAPDAPLELGEPVAAAPTAGASRHPGAVAVAASDPAPSSGGWGAALVDENGGRGSGWPAPGSGAPPAVPLSEALASIPPARVPPGVIAVGPSVRPAGVPGRSAAARPIKRVVGDGTRLPFGVRLVLRGGFGVSLFLVLLTVRGCPMRGNPVERALADWERTPEAGPGATAPDVAAAQTAREWVDVGNHHFKDPVTGELLVDKDPIRGLINRLHRLGARAVFVYGVRTEDLMVYAEGLDVLLPDEPQKRRAVFLEEARFHRREDPREPDIGQERLRIEVP